MDPEQAGDLFRFIGGSPLAGRLAVLSGLIRPEDLGRPLRDLLTPAQIVDLERQEAEIRRADRGEPSGRALGPYLLVESLGGGASAVVWKAWDTRLRRWVAVKEARLDGPASRERFLREARAASKVRHPHLIEAFDVGREGEVDYLAMRLVDGLPLDRAGHDARSAARAVADVAGAVQALHDAGLIHRDIKPQNILQDAEGRAILADFGIARDLSVPALTLEGAVLGTPHYMAPEQAAGKQDLIREAADVYALGATLYHLAGGCPPFAGESLPSFLGKIATEAPAALRGVPRDLDAIVRRAMEKNPADRYPSASAMAEDLRRFLQGEPVRSGPGILRWARRRSGWIAAATVAPALLAAIWIPLQRRADSLLLHDEGVEFWAQGDLVRAEGRFAAAGERPEALLMRGRCLQRMGRSREAVETWDRLIAAHPAYGPALLERGKLRLAAELQRRLPASARWSRRRGVFERPSTAADPDLERARGSGDLNPDEAGFLDGERELRLGRPQVAARALSSYATSHPWDATAHSLHAAAAFVAGDYAAAEAALTKAIDLEPRPLCFLARGDARFAGGRHDAALEDYTRAGEEARRGLALRALDRLPEAEAAFDKALAAESSARTLINRGTVRAERKDLAGARKDFEAALELDEMSADAYHNLAGVCFLENAFEEAVRHYDLALGCDAGFPDPYVGRARTRLRLNQPERAVADFDQALRRESDDPDLLLEAGSVFHFAGEKARGVDALRRALAKAPADWASRPAAEKLLAEWTR